MEHNCWFGLVGFLDPSLYSVAFLSANDDPSYYYYDNYQHIDLITLGVLYGISAFLHLFLPSSWVGGWLMFNGVGTQL